MKWYKHKSKSLNDSVIFEAIEKFGSDGYLVFFGTLELISDEFDIFNPGIIRLSMKKMTKNFQLSRQKTVRILRFFDQKAKEDPLKNTSFFVEFNNDHVIVTCNKLAKLSDTHTSKLLRDTSKLLQSKNEVTSSHRSKKEEERSKKEEERLKEKDIPASKEASSKKQVFDSSVAPLDNDKCPHQEIVNLYHEILPEMAKVKKWPPSLQKILRARWREEPERKTLTWWKAYFLYIRKSPFLLGQKGDFIADLEWIIRPINMTKIINGRYHRGSSEMKKFAGIKEWLKKKEEVQDGNQNQQG